MSLLSYHHQPEEPDENPEVAASGAERVIFFSDAVVAIAITLLALGLPVPTGTDSTTNGQLLRALGDNWPDYLAFFISFYVIGNHWAAHRRVFKYVNKLNGAVSTLNMGWLLLMIMVPFAARLVAGNGAFGIRFTIYCVIQLTASASMLLISRRVLQDDLIREDAPDSVRHPDNAHTIGLIVSFLVSIPVSFFTHWAFAVWAASSLVSRAVRRWRAVVPESPAKAGLTRAG